MKTKQTATALDEFTRAYIECALWSSTDEDSKSLDASYSVADLAPETLDSMVKDCRDFQESFAELLALAYEKYTHSPDWIHEEQAGHDFWLTRNRHGAGFWDRGLGDVGQVLTDMAHPYGEVNLYVGDDGRIYA